MKAPSTLILTEDGVGGTRGCRPTASPSATACVSCQLSKPTFVDTRSSADIAEVECSESSARARWLINRSEPPTHLGPSAFGATTPNSTTHHFWCGESNSICLAFQRDFYDGLQYEAVELEMDGKTRVSIQSMEGGMQALSMPTWTRQQQAAGSRGSSCIQ